MTEKRIILSKELLEITLRRLSQQLIENHGDFENVVFIGLQPRGVFFAERLKQVLFEITSKNILLGKLDITFFRDDFRRRDAPIRANKTDVPFLIEGKDVVIVDDVLFTGRSIRAALDAMAAFGRPASVELMVLIDRLYTRELPIEPNYVGKQINSMVSQKVIVEWKGVEQKEEDNICLINQEGI